MPELALATFQFLMVAPYYFPSTQSLLLAPSGYLSGMVHPGDQLKHVKSFRKR